MRRNKKIVNDAVTLLRYLNLSPIETLDCFEHHLMELYDSDKSVRIRREMDKIVEKLKY